MLQRASRLQIANQATRQKNVRSQTFPAPVAGLVLVDSLVKSRPASAQRLENIFPQKQNCRIRGGSQWWTRVPGTPNSFLAYRQSGQEKLFLTTDDAMYDATATLPQENLYLYDENDDPLLDSDGEPILAAEGIPINITDRPGGYFSYVNFATSGDSYLVGVNGADPIQLFDGTTWQDVTDVSVPIAITGIADTSVLSFVSAYRNRLFFVEGGTMDIWYLPVNSVGGVAEMLTMAGIFELGGAVLFTATWSMDAGDGLDDKFVVVSTQGEIAVFQGSDPGDPNDWSLVGRYVMTEPLGPRATMKAGGDVLVATVEGFTPISATVTKDPAALSLVSASEVIDPAWNTEARDRRALPWEVIKWPTRNMAFISLPTESEDPEDHFCFVVNVETGAWTKYTGWNVRCMELFNDQVFIANPDGRVLRAEQGGDDDGTPYNPLWVGNWDDTTALGKIKTYHQARGHLLARSDVNAQVSVSVDYRVSLPPFPAAAEAQGGAFTWDVSVWDGPDVWDGGGGPFQAINTRWRSIGQTGYAHAIQFQMTCSDPSKIEAEIVEVTVTYEPGGLVL